MNGKRFEHNAKILCTISLDSFITYKKKKNQTRTIQTRANKEYVKCVRLRVAQWNASVCVWSRDGKFAENFSFAKR